MRSQSQHAIYTRFLYVFTYRNIITCTIHTHGIKSLPVVTLELPPCDYIWNGESDYNDLALSHKIP